ncbi:hypothetical protein D3C78_1007740 [compost metagenome]
MASSCSTAFCRSSESVSSGQVTNMRRSFSLIGHGMISLERNTAFMWLASSQPLTNLDSIRTVLPVIMCLILPTWL